MPEYGDILRLLTEDGTLSVPHFKTAFQRLVDGDLLPIEAAAFLVALKMKKESALEIKEAAAYLRTKALQISLSQRQPLLLDTCGTGGSGFNKLNVSTAVFFIAAAAGIPVAKHGNRAASGRCGSADILEAMGIKIDSAPEAMQRVFETTKMAFLFAPLYHPALKALAPVRKELKVRTIFNLLGPLCNPYVPTHQVMGVSSRRLLLPMAQALALLKVTRAFVVHAGGLDEASLHTATEYVEVRKGKVLDRKRLLPRQAGLQRVPLARLAVSNTAPENAERVLKILAGTDTSPHRDMILLNAAMALVLTGKSVSFRAGVRRAAELIDTGAVLKKYQEFKEAVNNA